MCVLASPSLLASAATLLLLGGCAAGAAPPIAGAAGDLAATSAELSLARPPSDPPKVAVEGQPNDPRSDMGASSEERKATALRLIT